MRLPSRFTARLMALSILVTGIATTASAQLMTERGIDAASAQTVLQGCFADAEAKQQRFSIIVVDSGGHLVAALRMQGARPGNTAFATEKAKAAALWGFATSRMERSAENLPGFADAPAVVTVAGGVPIYSADGKQILGAIGVSGGAPSADEACAKAGITAAGLQAERVR
ncbi:GlcG/HbpS family heme-binding protein [Alterisphingorhabdus coralli]|uniref:Heme-binding protein n=1 Tax=Alterisphingorhabdus coralli TaxID=3071408 RepID=A0AA97I1G9_9SPHN|nr:heme-binding protein [Parasphingorhabdus sp. SCSIO 66989]WOE75285.1 heme-binding protein [Parasphingorhabdus sp. SCSIO 66989]